MSSIIQTPDQISLSKRRFLKIASAVLVAPTASAFGSDGDFWNQPREIWLRRPQTGEQVKAVYWFDGGINWDGYAQICHLLRDTHLNSAVQMDLVLLDVLRGTYGWLQAFGLNQPIDILSGYRHPTTNAREGGVKNSLHIAGKAADVRISGVATEKVSQFGLYLAGGGVGYYAGKHFTHLDTGRIRVFKG